MKVICQLSGGLDSVLSTLLVAENAEVTEFQTQFVNVRQPYLDQESRAVRYMFQFLTEKYPDKYKGHNYGEVSLNCNKDPNLPSAYIPVRNLVIGAMSANLALAEGYNGVATGSKTTTKREGDPYSFSDCSTRFHSLLSQIASFASEDKMIYFWQPLVCDFALSKKNVIEALIDRGVDLSRLWSCYSTGDTHCGDCYHCEEIKKTGYWEKFACAS